MFFFLLPYTGELRYRTVYTVYCHEKSSKLCQEIRQPTHIGGSMNARTFHDFYGMLAHGKSNVASRYPGVPNCWATQFSV